MDTMMDHLMVVLLEITLVHTLDLQTVVKLVDWTVA